jgi:hypothetical protein
VIRYHARLAEEHNMAKFSQYTLNQVAGFDQQILAQQLVINQKDFWNFVWSINANTAGWNTNTGTPVDLTGCTISAEIKRRQIVNLEDSRGGINFTIVDYPAPEAIGIITEYDGTNFQTSTEVVNNLYVTQPVYFKNVLSGLTANELYTIATTEQPGKFTLTGFTGSATTGAMTMYNGLFNNTPTIELDITNRDDAAGSFTMIIDESTWDNIQNDPGFNINATDPVAYTGRLKVEFPAIGPQPAYDEVIFLLFLVTTDGVTN